MWDIWFLIFIRQRPFFYQYILNVNFFFYLIKGAKSPICAVSGAQYLTISGWSELRNPIDTDVPFRLFRDEGRTFLQVKFFIK